MSTMNDTAAAAATSATFANYSSGDTAWILISTALVFFMTPGLALFYGGLVRSKHSVNMIAQNMAALAVVSIQWFFWGYSLAFSKGSYVYGDLKKVFFSAVELNDAHPLAPTVPEEAFAMYQMMFAIITPALITGATADRFAFKPYLVFLFAWATLVYDPICHMVWSPNGWMHQMGVLDFAGGLVVHVAAATAALVTAMFLGPRVKVRDSEVMNAPHSVTLVVIGTAILWFGWFGFNAGSAENAGPQAVSAFTASHIAAAFAGMTWWLLEYRSNDEHKPTVIGLCTGFVAGLAAVTPAAGYIEPLPAMAIGVLSAFVGYYMIKFGEHMGFYDDALGVFAVHGCGSAMGVLMTGVFANRAIADYSAPSNTFGSVDNDNPGGWLNHNYKQLGIQLLCLVVTVAWSAIFTSIICVTLKYTIGLRASEADEKRGMDHATHGEYRSEYDHPNWTYSAKLGHGLVDAKKADAEAEDAAHMRNRTASTVSAAPGHVAVTMNGHHQHVLPTINANAHFAAAAQYQRRPYPMGMELAAPAPVPATPSAATTTETTSSAFDSAMASWKF